MSCPTCRSPGADDAARRRHRAGRRRLRNLAMPCARPAQRTRGALHYRYSETAGLVFGSIVVHEAAREANESHDGGTRSNARPTTRTARCSTCSIRSACRIRCASGIPCRRSTRCSSGSSAIVSSISAASTRSMRAAALTGGVPAMRARLGRAGRGRCIAGRAARDPFPREPHAGRSGREPAVSAYHYPAQYGPRAPTFARCRRVVATRCRAGAVRVGHREHRRAPHRASRRRRRANARDGREPRGRARAAARQGHGPFSLADLSYRVYVRDAGDAAALAAIERVLREAAGPACGRSSSMRTCAATTCWSRSRPARVMRRHGCHEAGKPHDRATGPTRGRRRRSLPTVAGKS